VTLGGRLDGDWGDGAGVPNSWFDRLTTNG